jgi:outer membrane protein TolC
MVKKLYPVTAMIAASLLSLATLRIAESKPINGSDLALFQAELENRRVSYQRTRLLGKEGAVSQTYVDQTEAKYKLFATQVIYYQRLAGNEQKDYARLLKIQIAESCPQVLNPDPSDKIGPGSQPNVLPSPPSPTPGNI